MAPAGTPCYLNLEQERNNLYDLCHKAGGFPCGLQYLKVATNTGKWSRPAESFCSRVLCNQQESLYNHVCCFDSVRAKRILMKCSRDSGLQLSSQRIVLTAVPLFDVSQVGSTPTFGIAALSNCCRLYFLSLSKTYYRMISGATAKDYVLHFLWGIISPIGSISTVRSTSRDGCKTCRGAKKTDAGVRWGLFCMCCFIRHVLHTRSELCG